MLETITYRYHYDKFDIQNRFHHQRFHVLNHFKIPWRAGVEYQDQVLSKFDRDHVIQTVKDLEKSLR